MVSLMIANTKVMQNADLSTAKYNKLGSNQNCGIVGSVNRLNCLIHLTINYDPFNFSLLAFISI